MESTSEIKPPPKPEIFFDNKNLAPIEHILIGSSVTFHGEFLNSESFLKKLKEGNGIDRDMLIPGRLLEDSTKIEETRIARADKGYLQGILSFLSESQIDLIVEGLSPCMELPQMTEQSGAITPSWRIFLFDDKKDQIDNNPANLKNLSLNSSMRDSFKLEFIKETGELILSPI